MNRPRHLKTAKNGGTAETAVNGLQLTPLIAPTILELKKSL